MRNLIRVHCKRFFFRWETYALTLWNLFLGMVSLYLASVLYWDYGASSRTGFIWFFLLFYVLALGGTIAGVTSMETNNLSSGGLRNLVLGGYSKVQIFISKYLVMTLFGAVQGALFIAPVTFLRVAGDYAVGLLISSILVFAAFACAIMACCLMTDRQTTAVLCCFFGAALLAAGAVYGASALDQPEYT